jgi:hypothetical protein
MKVFKITRSRLFRRLQGACGLLLQLPKPPYELPAGLKTATCRLGDYNLTNATNATEALEQAKKLSGKKLVVAELGAAMTYSFLLGVNDFEFDVGTHASTVKLTCTPDASLPARLVEYCCNDVAANCTDVEPGCNDPYGAYERWCDPLLCYDIKGKELYVRAMQGASALGGLYGLFMLVFVSIIWRICLWYGRPHWKPAAAPAAEAAAAGDEDIGQLRATRMHPQHPPGCPKLTPQAGGSHRPAALQLGAAPSPNPGTMQLSSMSSGSLAITNPNAPLPPAVSMTPVPPTPNPAAHSSTNSLLGGPPCG